MVVGYHRIEVRAANRLGSLSLGTNAGGEHQEAPLYAERVSPNIALETPSSTGKAQLGPLVERECVSQKQAMRKRQLEQVDT